MPVCLYIGLIVHLVWEPRLKISTAFIHSAKPSVSFFSVQIAAFWTAVEWLHIILLLCILKIDTVCWRLLRIDVENAVFFALISSREENSSSSCPFLCLWTFQVYCLTFSAGCIVLHCVFEFFFVYFTDYEIVRQISVLEAGEEVVNETRAYDFATGYDLYEFALCS